MVRTVEWARQVTDAAGFPLRDRWGYPAPDSDVQFVMDVVATNPTDDGAINAILDGFIAGSHALAGGYDEPTDEEYERGIIRALRR